MIRKSLAALALAAALAPLAAHAEPPAPAIDDPISLRMNLMSDVGATMGVMAAMAKGETEFNAGAAKAALVALNAAAMGFPAQFPEGATGAPSEAAPAIWENPEGFEAAAAKFIADTYQAKGMEVTDVESLKQAMGVVGANCRACHQDYRERN